MIYQAARWRKRGVGSGGGGGAVGALEGGTAAAIAMVNLASNKGGNIIPDVDGDSDLVSA